MESFQAELEELMSHPDGGRILGLLDRQESAGSGDVADGVTTAFYRWAVGLGCKDLAGNLRLRRRLLEACRGSERVRDAVFTMCSRDILFWVNLFCWTYDPRNLGNPGSVAHRRLPKTIPFVTFEYQDDALRLLQWCVMNGVDGLIEKSRDMGASWVFVMVFDWFFLFRRMSTFLMVSRKEDLVDKKEDPDSLFWKLDFLHESMPQWMVPEISRQKLHFRNNVLGGTIDGESTTGDVGRGGRRTAIALDEFAAVPDDESQGVINATNDATDCRIFNSTPKGVGNAYHQQTRRDDIVRIRMHWSQHPHKRDGLYYCEKGKCPLHPEGGQPHSKWYDRECRRRGWNSTAIAQELDIDYSRAGGTFFSGPLIEELVTATSRYRLFEGELEYDAALAAPQRFVPVAGGSLRMWVVPDVSGNVPQSEYAIGCDIAEGTGASFSCASVVSLRTGEKVAEYTNPLLKPYQFAALVVSLARRFVDERGVPAFLIWEANGPGREFGDHIVKRLGYTRVWHRPRMANSIRSKFPGWQSTADEKIALFGAYRRSLAERLFVNRSAPALKETVKYVTNDNGVPEYRGAMDMNRVGSSHGDVVVADALANKVLEERKMTIGVSPDGEEEQSCLATRIAEARRGDGDERWLDLQMGAG